MLIPTLTQAFQNAGIASGSSVKLFGTISEKPGEGRYITEASGNKYFVRISERLQGYQLATELNNFLASRKCNVIPVIYSGEILSEDKKFRIDIRPYYEGRAFNGSSADFSKVLFEVLDIHNKLKEFPGKDHVIARANEINKQLNYIQANFVELEAYKKWINPHKKMIAKSIETFDFNLGFSHDAQCIHADLHSSNVLFTSDLHPYIFDFDESSKYFLNPGYDLMYLLTRFQLNDKETKSTADLVREYFKETDTEALLQKAKMLPLRLILIVFRNTCFEKVPLNTSELAKFTNSYLSDIS